MRPVQLQLPGLRVDIVELDESMNDRRPSLVNYWFSTTGVRLLALPRFRPIATLLEISA